MPTFPSYQGPPLPEVLNPLNPRHYLMLADWIFFKPSRLKQYLYRADPELYFQSGIKALLRAMRLPAYRNLLLMVPLLVFVLFVIAAAVSWAASAAQETAVDWWGVAVVVAVVVAFVVAAGVAVGVAAVAALVVAVGVALGVAWGVALGVAGGVAVGVASGVAVGVAVGVASGVAVGVASGVAVGVGTLRGVFYLFQVWPALWLALRPGPAGPRLTGHPALGDELAVLPFPGLGRLLADALAEDPAQGLRAARALLRNSCQRWAVARGWARFLANAPDPLGALYDALPNPLWREYLLEPMDQQDLRFFPPVLAVWLGELSGEFVDPTGGESRWIRLAEQAVWAITRPLRGRPHPQIVPLARLLLALLDEDRVAQEGVDAVLLEDAVSAVRPLPRGEEVALSIATLARLGGVEDVDRIAAAWEEMDWLEHLLEPPLRPQVLEALRGLGDVAAEMAHFQQATSPAAQAAAVNRAVGMLEELERFAEKIHLPERALLLRVVRRWQSLVAEAAGRLGERALREIAPDARRALTGTERRATFWARPAEPFASPYQVGRPVRPPLFVGREEVLEQIREVWTRKANPDSVILYGHRRMGKTSILQNLGEIAPSGSLLVYADLRGQSAFTEGTHHFLRNLAQEVAWAAQERGLTIPDPSPEDYAAPADAARSFRGLLRRVVGALPEGGSLILALDEFETVDALIRDPARPFGPELYDFLRDISFQERVALVLAGLHTLDEMSRDYRHAFHESYVNIHVSYLSPEAARRLITRPTPDFRLNYHPRVVERIIELTHGQPLLIQRICTELIHHLNHELFDLEKDREARVLPEDLDAVLTDDFIRHETRYFEGIWRDQIEGRAAEEAVLRALAAGPMPEEALVRAMGPGPEEALERALAYLRTRDLIGKDATGCWDLLVPLMRRWLRLREESAEG